MDPAEATAPPQNSFLPHDPEQARRLSSLGKIGRAADGSEGLGMWARIGLVFGILFATRVGASHLSQVDHRMWLFGAVLATMLGTETLRRAVLQTTLAVVVVSLVIAVIESGHLPRTEKQLRGVVEEASRLAVGFGPGDQLRKLIDEERRRHHIEVIERSEDLLKRGAGGRSGALSDYVLHVDTRSDAIISESRKVVERCHDDDRLCECVLLNRRVASGIRYRRDPRGGADPPGRTDHVQSPTETLRLGAGDCEDQSILLVSLLGSVGFKTYLAFTTDHVYPLVCFERRLSELVEVALRTRDHAYLHGLGPSPDATLTLAEVPDVQGFEIPEGGTSRFCYPLEPTNPEAWIGFRHDTDAIQAVLDTETGRPLGFRRSLRE